MLKKFRSLFSQRTPVEFEVHRRPPEGLESANDPLALDNEASGVDPANAPTLKALEQVHVNLELQRESHAQIASSLAHVEEQLEPMTQRLGQQMDSIAGSGREIAELVSTFHSAEKVREDAFKVSMQSITVAAEQQLQVLSVLQQQIDHSQQSMTRLAERFDDVGSGLKSLLEEQRNTASLTEDLVEAVRLQVDATTHAHQRLFGVTIALIAIGSLSLIGSVVLAIVYAT